MKYFMDKTQLFIAGHVPSSKNSRIWTGRRSISSKAVTKWRAETNEQWIQMKPIFLEKISNKEFPLKIGFHFVRKSRHLYDFINPLQTIQDEMVKHEWLPEDNMTILIPFPLLIGEDYTTYDKKNPGVIIKIL